jgi:signal transduction histidine kinase
VSAPLRSFRYRLIWAAILSTAGLLAMSHAGWNIMMRTHMHGAHTLFFWIFACWALVLLVLGLDQWRRALSPFTELRVRLVAVRDGSKPKLEGTYPEEVQPLVQDLNELLEHREQMVQQAKAKAGDLAHGLKTPLALLMRQAEIAASKGHDDVASAISEQVTRMRQQIDYHLAHSQAAAATIAANPAIRCSVSESVEGLVRTMQHLHAERRLQITVDTPADHVVRGRREDLDEMIGNLLDNACKWSKSSINIYSRRSPGFVSIVIDDDGPGIPAALRQQVLQRGVRADESAPGSGLGLAIVRDLVDLHRGKIELSESPAGGLRATLTAPVP